RPLELCAQAAVQPEAAAAELDAALEVDEPKPRGDVHVVAEALREVRLRAPLADDLVVLLAAGRDARVGQVRQLEHQLAQPLLDLLELRRQRAQLLASRGGRRLELGRVLTGPLALADLLPDPL